MCGICMECKFYSQVMIFITFYIVCHKNHGVNQVGCCSTFQDIFNKPIMDIECGKWQYIIAINEQVMYFLALIERKLILNGQMVVEFGYIGILIDNHQLVYTSVLSLVLFILFTFIYVHHGILRLFHFWYYNVFCSTCFV